MTKKTIITGIVIWTVAAVLIATTFILFVKLKPFGSDDKSGISSGFGNVVYRDGDIYFWKYSKDSFSSDEAKFGSYTFRADATNQLVCMTENGEETVIVSANGLGKICIAGDRIFYQRLRSDWIVSHGTDNFNIESCSVAGDDVKTYGEGILLGLIDDGKYLITEIVQNEKSGIYSIDTQTHEKTLISEDSFLICSDNAVVCSRSNHAESGFDEEETVYTVSGNGLETKDLHTEKASTLPSLMGTDWFDGYVYVDYPLIIDNKLFYIYKHVYDTASTIQSSRIMCVNMDTCKATEIPGSVHGARGILSEIDIDSSDEDVVAYKNHISDLQHLHALDKEDYAGFSDLDVSVYGDETGLLDVDYIEKIGDYEYVFMKYGKFSQEAGWRIMHKFSKCALFKKNTKTGECSLIYSTMNQIKQVDYITASEDDFRLLEQTLSEIQFKWNRPSYDAETTDVIAVFDFLVDRMGGMAGFSDPEVFSTELGADADPLNKYTGAHPYGNLTMYYYGYWFVPIDLLRSAASNILGYDEEFPDELYEEYELIGPCLIAYRYNDNYYIGIPSGIDGTDGLQSVKVKSNNHLDNGKYRVLCDVQYTFDDVIIGSYNYSITTGLREENGEKFWTIYSFDITDQEG